MSDIKNPILPSFSDRPNPLLDNGILFLSTFSPGCVLSLDAASGEIIWRRELPGYGGSSTFLSGNILLAKTSQSVYALEVGTGKIVWEFCPYGYEGEWIYSSPTVKEDRVFLGDRKGWLHCLDLQSGKTIWKHLISEGSSRNVNATACIFDNLVITAANARFAQALSIEDGETAWKTDIDGPCSQHLFLSNEKIVVPANSLHFLTPINGNIEHRLGWDNYHIAFAAGTPSGVISFRRMNWNDGMTDVEKKKYSQEGNVISMIDRNYDIREIHCSEFAQNGRYSYDSNFFYISGIANIDIIDPATGVWLNSMQSRDEPPGYSIPEISQGKIFVICNDGFVYALRDPAADR